MPRMMLPLRNKEENFKNMPKVLLVQILEKIYQIMVDALQTLHKN